MFFLQKQLLKTVHLDGEIARLNRVYYETCERLFLEDKYARFQKTYGVCFDGSIDI